jgi:hypothetical protein
MMWKTFRQIICSNEFRLLRSRANAWIENNRKCALNCKNPLLVIYADGFTCRALVSRNDDASSVFHRALKNKTISLRQVIRFVKWLCNYHMILTLFNHLVIITRFIFRLNFKIFTCVGSFKTKFLKIFSPDDLWWPCKPSSNWLLSSYDCFFKVKNPFWFLIIIKIKDFFDDCFFISG